MMMYGDGAVAVMIMMMLTTTMMMIRVTEFHSANRTTSNLTCT